MCLNYKIYNILVFSCKTIQIVSANLTYDSENKFYNSPNCINNESKKKGNFKCFFSSEKEKYSPGINKKGGGNYDNCKDSTIIKGTYTKDGTPGENSQNIESGSNFNITSFFQNTTYKKELKEEISKQKNGKDANNKKNNEGIIEEEGNYGIRKKLNFDNIDANNNSESEYSIEVDNNIKLNNKEKVINGKTQQIIKTETNNRCCCCQ